MPVLPVAFVDCETTGLEPDDFDRHTALGDARWAKAVYEAVMQ